MDICTVIILAGGEGTRMRLLGELFPKPTMVAFDKPLLVRLTDQFLEAHFTDIIISTRSSLYAELTRVITQYYETSIEEQYEGGPHIQVVDNSEHVKGSLEALLYILKTVKTPYSLMCFSDIFFLENPFHEFLRKKPQEVDFLGIAPAVEVCELTQGGIVYYDAERITSIVERPQANPVVEGAARWSGIALFDTKEITQELEYFLQKVPQGSPEGDIFEFRRKQGKHIQAIWGPDFVNVNSPEHLLLTTLYAVAEYFREQPILYEAMRNAGSLLRSMLL